MALSKHSVDKAFYLFRDILKADSKRIGSSWVTNHDHDDPFRTNIIIGVDKKSDDGWENVFMNIEHMTPEQVRIWDNRKIEVPNTSFIETVAPGITRIGFI